MNKNNRWFKQSVELSCLAVYRDILRYIKRDYRRSLLFLGMLTDKGEAASLHLHHTYTLKYVQTYDKESLKLLKAGNVTVWP